MKVFIGCSSYDTIDKKYYEDAEIVSRECIKKGYDLVFGCATGGLMGKVYNEFKNSDRNVYPVCLECYKDDAAKVEYEVKMVPSVHDQIGEFIKADKIIYLPGGYGTLCEIFYIINGHVTGEVKSDIIIVNSHGYYSGVKEMLEKIENEKFARDFGFVKIIDDASEISMYL